MPFRRYLDRSLRSSAGIERSAAQRTHRAVMTPRVRSELAFLCPEDVRAPRNRTRNAGGGAGPFQSSAPLGEGALAQTSSGEAQRRRKLSADRSWRL